jgi:hypothetical protein
MAVRSESVTMDAIYRSNESLVWGRNNSRSEWVRDSDVIYLEYQTFRVSLALTGSSGGSSGGISAPSMILAIAGM